MDSRGFYKPILVSEQGYIQERLTLPMINRIRNRTPVSLESLPAFWSPTPSPPTVARSVAKATARARLERLVLEQHAARKGERKSAAGCAAAAESVPAPAPAPSPRRLPADAAASPPRVHSPTSVIQPHAMLTSTMSATADSAATAQAVLYTQQHIAAQTEQIEALAACLLEERLRRISRDKIAEEYLAPGVGRLASQGA